MAQLAFAAGGAAAGYGIGGTSGIGIGLAAGGLVYSLLNPPDDIVQEGPRLNNQLRTTSAYGLMRPIMYGTIPVNGNIIDGSALYETRHEDKSSSGGKGGIGGGQDVVTVTYTYSIDLAVALGEGPIDEILKVYANDKLIFDITGSSTITSPEWLNMTVYKGTEDQLPDPTLQVLHGADTPAYRGEAYVVFTRFQLQEFGNNIPSFRFLVVSNSNPVISEDQKVFGGSSNVGALLYNPNNTLLYYASSGQTGTRIGYVYDPLTESEVISLRWSDDYDRIDEGGGGGLFSMPNVVDGVTISSGSNAHFFVNVEAGIDPSIAIYEATTGAYLGTAALNITLESNTKAIISDERKGIIFRPHNDAPNFNSYLEAWDFALVNGVIDIVNLGFVSAPFSRNTDEWRWNGEPSYPEGTNRNGLILMVGRDSLDGDKEYLCLINNDSPPLIEQFIAPTEYSTITAIAWDSIQSYFWVMGESSNTGNTRLKAYDLGLNEQVNIEWTNTLYVLSQDYFTYDSKNFSLWLFNNNDGTIYQWHTVNHNFANTYPGFSAGTAGTGDSIAYVNATRTVWRKKGLGLLDLYRLGRIVDSGVGLDVVVDDLCKRARLDLTEYDVSELSSVIVDGYKIEKDGDVRSKLVPLQQTYLFDGIDKADEIEFKFRGQAKSETIPQNDLGASTGNTTGGEFIKIDRIMDLDLPKKTEVSYYNRAAEYEQNTQMARRLASFTDENSSRYTLPVVLTDDEGARLADVLVHLPYIEREIYDVSVLPKWQFLVNGDVIGIEYEGREFIARIVQKDFEDGIVNLKCTREDSSVLTSFLEGGSPADRDITIRYNPLTNSVHLDIPLLLESNDNAGYYLSACGMDTSWTGGNIYRSADGNSFNILATVLSPSIIGTMDQTLANPPDHLLWDRNSVARVYMRCGTLSSVTESEALKGANTLAIGVHGRWEIVSFVNATLVEEGVYDIDTFIRGRLGTEWAVGTHQLGDIVCFLSTDDLTYISDNLANLNIQYLMRAVSLGGSIYSDRVIDQFHTNTGVCLKPYAPAGFEATKKTNLDILYQWRERSRYLWRDYWSGITSNNNTYDLVIKRNDGTIARTESSLATESFLYTRAQQVADGFPSDDSELSPAECYALSTTYPTNGGRGYPSTLSQLVGPFPDPVIQYAFSIGGGPIWALTEADGTGGAVDSTGIFNGTYENDNDVLNYGQPSIYPATTKTCIEIERFAAMAARNMPANTVNAINYSLAIFIQPQVSATKNQYILAFQMPSVNARIRWLSTNQISLWHSNGQTGESPIEYIATETLSPFNTAMIVYTFQAVDEDTYGDSKLYINGQLSLDMPNIRMRSGAVAGLKEIISGWDVSGARSTTDLQKLATIMVFDHKLTQAEVSNLYSFSGL